MNLTPSEHFSVQTFDMTNGLMKCELQNSKLSLSLSGAWVRFALRISWDFVCTGLHTLSSSPYCVNADVPACWYTLTRQHSIIENLSAKIGARFNLNLKRESAGEDNRNMIYSGKSNI